MNLRGIVDMIREYSEEKKREIFDALDSIVEHDVDAYEDFMTKSYRDCGIWMERFEIDYCVREMERCWEELIHKNDEIKRQIEAVFQRQMELDVEYQKELKKCSSELQGQIRLFKGLSNSFGVTTSSASDNKEKYIENREIIKTDLGTNEIYDIFIEMLEKYGQGDTEVAIDDLLLYIKYLYDNNWICKYDYDYIVCMINAYKYVPASDAAEIKQQIKKLLNEREYIINYLVGQEWERSKIICVIQMEKMLFLEGYDEAFIMGMLGQIICEGDYGEFEDCDYKSSPMPDYLAHVITCIDYDTRYDGKYIMEVDLIQVYYDLVCVKEVCKYERHGFGVGCIQFTFDRTVDLLELYFKEIGCPISSDDFTEKLEAYKEAVNSGDFSEYDATYINVEQAQTAEMSLMCQELKSDQYCDVYEGYLSEKTGDIETDIANATESLVYGYIKPGNEEAEIEKRTEAALNWYQLTSDFR